MKIRITLSIIWLIFAVLFFFLASRHKAKSKQTIPKFEIEIRSTGGNVKIIGVDFREFVTKFNAYVADQNESNREANLNAYLGFLVAGLTSLFAMGLEWEGYIGALWAKLVLLVKSQKTTKNNNQIGNN